MAFKPADTKKKVSSTKKVFGYIRKGTNVEGFHFEVASGFDLAVYNEETGEYFRVKKLPAFIKDENGVVFRLLIDLANDKHVELMGK